MKKKKILNDIKNLMFALLPGKVHKIILYGSQISGKITGNSDFDILIILDSDTDWKLENKILENFYKNIDLKYDILTDVRIINISLLDTPFGQQPFFRTH